jgi:very-short-patch-repair endonuclease
MKAKARELRKNQTDAEKLLWYYLRNRQLTGHKFRRQHPIGRFFADFACIEKTLIVEIDGGQHALARDKDNQRTAYLESEGFTVLRFWNNQVLNETEAMLERIKSLLDSPPSPQPSPPKMVEREK